MSKADFVGPKKNIIFLNDIAFLKAHRNEIIKTINLRSFLVVPLSDPALYLVRSWGIDCEDYKSCAVGEKYLDLYPQARKWGMSWYKPQGKDLTLLDGVSMGQIMEWSLIYYFSHLIKLYVSIEAVIKKLRPEKILVLAGSKTDIDSQHIGYANVHPAELPEIVLAALQRAQHRAEMEIKCFESCPILSERALFIRLIVLLGTIIQCAVNGALRIKNYLLNRSKKLIFFGGAQHYLKIMNSKYLHNIDKVHLQEVLGPRLLSKLYPLGVRMEVLKKKKSKKKSFHVESTGGPDIESTWKDYFIFRDQNLLLCVSRRLQWVFQFFCKTLSRDIEATDAMMRRIRPCGIALTTDATYYERIVTLVGNKLGIPTVVIQHGGITRRYDPAREENLVSHGMRPLLASYFLAYGDESRQWMVDAGVNSSQIIVTGAPRFDKYYPLRKKPIEVKQRKKKTVLIVLQDVWFFEGVVTDHLAITLIHQHIEKFLEWAQRSPEIDFIIRPHDQHHCWDDFFYKQLESIQNCKISRDKSLDDILPRTDLVVGYHSTVLVEALIHRIPVITLDTGEYTNYNNLKDYGLAVNVTHFQELEKMAKIYLYDEKSIEVFKANVNKNIRIFNFEDDGAASERVARFLGELCREGRS